MIKAFVQRETLNSVQLQHKVTVRKVHTHFTKVTLTPAAASIENPHPLLLLLLLLLLLQFQSLLVTTLLLRFREMPDHQK